MLPVISLRSLPAVFLCAALAFAIAACNNEPKTDNQKPAADTLVQKKSDFDLIDSAKTEDAPEKMILGKWRQISMRFDDPMPLTKEKKQEYGRLMMNFDKTKDRFTLTFRADSVFEQTGLDLMTMAKDFKVSGDYVLSKDGNTLHYRLKESKAIGNFWILVQPDTLLTRTPYGSATLVSAFIRDNKR